MNHQIFPVSHQMVMASAGSGKTHALVSRYIKLLALEVDASNILALTFTRKAAGEFFTRIIQRLSSYAADSAARSDFLRSEGLDTRLQVLPLLRSFVSELHSLRLGTLDSFFANMARLYPRELGILPGFEIMDDFQAAETQREILEKVMEGEGRDEVAEGVKMASLGKEKARIEDLLQEWITQCHGLYQEAPQAEAWGSWSQIFHERKPWEKGRLSAWEDAVRTIKERLADDPKTGPNQITDLEKWESLFLQRAPGTPVEKSKETVFNNFLKALTSARNGASGEHWMISRKKYEIDDTLRTLIETAGEGWLDRELTVLCRRTMALRGLLFSYESLYDQMARRRGKLTFDDMPRLLQSGQLRNSGHGLMELNERMDATLHHWLLDEFQDTSRAQWRVIENMVDEVVQDSEGTRTFFVVGDTKQSIYAWRGGDDRLFSLIQRKYENLPAERQIDVTTLATTRRCGPAIVESVNRVFTPGNAMEGRALAQATWDRWQFEKHHCYDPDSFLRNHVALLQVDAVEATNHSDDDDADESEVDPWCDAVFALLDEIQLEGSGFTCALLVATNKQITTWVERLRSRGMAVSGEGKSFVAMDHAFGLALLALLKRSCHPKDTMAQEHVSMSMLGHVIAKDKTNIYQECTATRSVIANFGFEAWARGWWKRCLAHQIEFDAFAQERAEAFFAMAAECDAKGVRDPIVFSRLAEMRQVREEASPGCVEVLTIHRAKGLEWDVVIIPECKKISFGENSRPSSLRLAVHFDEDREPTWILEQPSKAIMEVVAPLREVKADREADMAYDTLCQLYVAMTRAKMGLYMLVPKPPKDPKSLDVARFLRTSLVDDNEPTPESWANATILWQTGSAFTCPRLEGAVSQSVPVSIPNAKDIMPFLPKPTPRRRPSSEGRNAVSAKFFTGQTRAKALEWGNFIHALMEHVAWVDVDSEETMLARWTAAGFASHDLWQTGRDHVLALLSTPEISVALSQSVGFAGELWREKRFEVLHEKSWISGSFDRVVWPGSTSTDPIVVLDYKTNHIDPEKGVAMLVEKYRPQMKLYQEILRKMSVNPPEIRAGLIFTVSRQLVWL